MAQHENMARTPDFTESYVHQKYLELAPVFDNSRSLYLNSNLTQVINDAILLTSIADSYFQDVRMRIQLLAVEVWTDRDKIALNSPELSQVLGQFVQYRSRDLRVRIPADWWLRGVLPAG